MAFYARYANIKSMKNNKKRLGSYLLKVILTALILGFVSGGVSTIWAISLPVPDFESFFEQQINEASTKIYDRSGEILLYDVRGIRRTAVPIESIPQSVKLATIAIEDADFYSHQGFKVSAIGRAFLVNLFSGGVKQGGSTISQQVVKNSLLTQERTIARKIREVILAVKMEDKMTKDEILNVYLNQSPYGGNIYGVQEAAKAYFKKDIGKVTLAEAAYLAALPQAPSYYSPYGKNRDKLEERKNLVLERMVNNKFITKEEASRAKNEKVIFYEKINQGIKAPHFVFYIKEYLDTKYGKENIESKGYKIITTIDWRLQEKAEEIARKYGEINEQKFKAQNNALVAIDPKTGEILAMVGSRDYFNQEIEGSFNVTTAHRQPGSSFKPFVYATAFKKGYTDKTVVFDLKTEFTAGCSPDNRPQIAGAKCYSPVNYDNKYLGPITLRDALAQSRNIPAVKVLYLAGINDSLQTARALGISSLGKATRYGLTLVLGGGEVSLLDMTSAYGVFANDGQKTEKTGILEVIDPQGRTLEKSNPLLKPVLDANIARLINNILSDNAARTPAFGARSELYFPNREVAVKTGTTNDYKDAWIIGYTPNITIGAWAGNNDNTPMDKQVAGYIIAPLWHEVMNEALERLPEERFIPPVISYSNLKPILRGNWQGGISNTFNAPGPNNSPEQVEYVTGGVHSILYWVDKNNPLGSSPINPSADPQFNLWEAPVRAWARARGYDDEKIIILKKQETTNREQENLFDQINILSPLPNGEFPISEPINITIDTPINLKIKQVNYFLNTFYLGSTNRAPFNNFSFWPENLRLSIGEYELKAVIYDTEGNYTVKTIKINLK